MVFLCNLDLVLKMTKMDKESGKIKVMVDKDCFLKGQGKV